MPWVTGAELRVFKGQTKDIKQWGNAQHIALSCRIWGIRILVHHEGFRIYEFGEEGKKFHILYGRGNGDTTGTHYDVLEERQNQQAENKEEAQQDEDQGSKS